MEPSIRLIERIMYPIATFSTAEPTSFACTDTSMIGENEPEWTSSMLNPRNRPDSLTPFKNAHWRMDGCQTDGHRMFIIPRFALSKPPQRVDIYLSDEDEYRLSQGLRSVLEPNLSMTVPSQAAWRVPLSQHILRGLEHWSRSEPNFQNMYTALPFGSYIVVESICADQSKLKIHMVPQYETEREWMSVQELADLWSRPGAPTVYWPKIIELQKLKFVSQPHEAISIVHIAKGAGEESKVLYAFKSVLEDLRYMYHELWRLLTLAPHSNIVARPLYIVTTRSRFGAKKGVCGFVLEYLPGGTMRELLAKSRANRRVAGDEWPQQQLSVVDKFRMAREITSALLHLQAQGTFYSGIKYTNVVMREAPTSSDGNDGRRRTAFSTLSPVLIDFDHRAGRFVWTPPEIYHSMHVEYLANAADEGHMMVPDSIRTRATRVMGAYFPSWKPERVVKKRGYLSCWDVGTPLNGFSAPWLALSPEQRDRSQVYMLGRLLWHLFEEIGAIDHCLHVEVFREAGSFDSLQPVFPEFSDDRNGEGRTRTPEPIRKLIRRCTAGAPEWDGKKPPLVFWQRRLWARGQEKIVAGRPCSSESERDAQEVMRSWWVNELQDAERFLLARSQNKAFSASRSAAHRATQLDLLDKIKSRPLLREVSRILEQEEAAILGLWE